MATKVCDHYRTLKIGSTEKTQVLFLQAVEYFFNEWAKERDYSIEEFKSKIATIIQRRRKKHVPDDHYEEMSIWKKLNPTRSVASEGNGAMFVLNQIAWLNLNVDSYL